MLTSLLTIMMALFCCRLSLEQQIGETPSSHSDAIAEACYTAVSRCVRLTDGFLKLAVAAAAVMADQACCSVQGV